MRQFDTQLYKNGIVLEEGDSSESSANEKKKKKNPERKHILRGIGMKKMYAALSSWQVQKAMEDGESAWVRDARISKVPEPLERAVSKTLHTPLKKSPEFKPRK